MLYLEDSGARSCTAEVGQALDDEAIDAEVPRGTLLVECHVDRPDAPAATRLMHK